MRWFPITRLGLAFTLLSPAFAGPVTVDDTGAEIVITLAVALCPEEGVTQQALHDFIAANQAKAEAILNANAHPFRTAPGGIRKRLRIQLTFEYLETCDAPRNPDRHRFRVRAGKPPDSSRSNATAVGFYTENDERTMAHEMGHALGLDDEYDPNSDNSNANLMGRSRNPHDRVVTDNHLMTILFTNTGNPDDKESLCRRTLRGLLRMYSRAEARRIFIQNCPAEMFDRLVALLDLNRVTLQPLPPP